MHKKDTISWLKHIDFIIWDMVCLQVAFALSYIVTGHGFGVYDSMLYRAMGLFLEFADIFCIVAFNTYKNIVKHGYYKDFLKTLSHTVMIWLVAVLTLVALKRGSEFSRLTLMMFPILYTLILYVVRSLWRHRLRSRSGIRGSKMFIITTSEVAGTVVNTLKNNNYNYYQFVGMSVIDADWTGRTIEDIKVVTSDDGILDYVCRHWVDEVIIAMPSGGRPYPQDLVDQLTATGVTVHYCLNGVISSHDKTMTVGRVGSYTVITNSIRHADNYELLAKRLLDVVGGLVGCILTGIIFIFIAPAIYISSPGPIFYKSTRIGQNGREFQMYKFRSMYLDADKRRAELMAENRISDGKMFKLDFDPRIIGNKVLPDGTHKTGIGEFIRRTSLDEFPQFINVLKGDMSIVGTRPPIRDEVDRYKHDEYARLAIKPGVTGLWQISGRSEITDFDEVVRLDREYIETWNIGKDIRIILKTIEVVVKGKGSM